MKMPHLPLWPRRLGSQIMLLVLLAVVSTYVIHIFLAEQLRPPPPRDFEAERLLLSILPLVADTPEAQNRAAIADLVNRLSPALDMTLIDNGQPEPTSEHDPLLKRFFEDQSMLDVGVFMVDGPLGSDNDRRLLFALPDGTGVLATLPPPPEPPGFFSPQIAFNASMMTLAVVLPLVLFFAVRGVSLQLRNFARAAEDFTIDGAHAPLDESGPLEIRTAAQALNSMRDRIVHLANDKTRMLSAIGHDLRTPLTRIRLRAEFVRDEGVRNDMMRDLERMEAMIDSVLHFLRDGKASAQRDLVDVGSLLQTIHNDFADLGKDITLQADGEASVIMDTDAMIRAIENLVQNALRFGTAVTLHLDLSNAETVDIVVEDNGPGIGRDQRQEMLKPFVSGDPARNAAESGFGLGLSITQSIVTAHGGSLGLGESAAGGLAARITLPRGA